MSITFVQVVLLAGIIMMGLGLVGEEAEWKHRNILYALLALLVTMVVVTLNAGG